MTMTDSPVLLRREGGVAIVTLNRPQAGHTIDLALARGLLEAAIACDCDASVRAVLLVSEGKLFCGGGDLKSFASSGDQMPAVLSDVTANLHAAVARLARMDKPLVVAVQGAAAGAGFSLAMLGDIVLAGESAQFTLAYTAIGLTPDGGASWLLPRLVGLRKAQEMILLNTRLKAAEALEAGLVTRVVADADLAGEALKLAQQLASGPTRAFGRARELLLGAFGESLETHLERESRGIVRSSGEGDGREGIDAFLNKRPPAFGG